MDAVLFIVYWDKVEKRVGPSYCLVSENLGHFLIIGSICDHKSSLGRKNESLRWLQDHHETASSLELRSANLDKHIFQVWVKLSLVARIWLQAEWNAGLLGMARSQRLLYRVRQYSLHSLPSHEQDWLALAPVEMKDVGKHPWGNMHSYLDAAKKIICSGQHQEQ